MADEIAWVIVHRNVTPGGPNYWCGNGWSIDNQRAIRFAREIDAQRTIAGFDEDDPLPNEQPHRVEEHMWLDGPRSPSVSGSPAPSTEGLREWQPIAGAPRDQNIIVAAMNTYSKTWIVGEARWQSDDPDHPDDGDWWWANISPGDYTGDSIMNMNGAVEFWQPLPLPPDAARTALAGVTAPTTRSFNEHMVEDLIVAAYKRGFIWANHNPVDGEFLDKAARDYADYTMNAPSAGVTAPDVEGR